MVIPDGWFGVPGTLETTMVHRWTLSRCSGWMRMGHHLRKPQMKVPTLVKSYSNGEEWNLFWIFLRMTSRGLQENRSNHTSTTDSQDSQAIQLRHRKFFVSLDRMVPIAGQFHHQNGKIYGKISRTTQTSAQRWPFGLLATSGQHHFLLEVKFHLSFTRFLPFHLTLRIS